MGFAVVLAGGDVPDRKLFAGIDEAELVVAADGGVRSARTYGLPIHAVVGDFDSIAEGDTAWATAEGAELIAFPPNKDETDLELAIAHADAVETIDRIVVLGIEGGRLDHEMGNWAVCSGPWRCGIDVHTARGTVEILRGAGRNSVDLDGEIGNLVSLLPRTGPAIRVNTSGLRWALEDAVLYPEGSRGLSNEFVETSGSVTIGEGVLFVARPEVSALA